MPDQPYLRESVVAVEQQGTAAPRYCAYNQTRECFLCSEIEMGDFAPSSLDTRLRSLAPGCGGALWLVPFRGISATSVRMPIDLIYLDHNNRVLDAVESFPIAGPSSGIPAASVLALPANTIAAAGTRMGDRLIICAPGEMKRRVQEVLAGQVQMAADAAAQSREANARTTQGRVLPWVDRSKAKAATEAAPIEMIPAAIPAVAEPEAPPAPPAPDIAQAKPKKKGWLERLLNPDPPQPRKAQREQVQGLAAFYFNGGDSTPHAVRDISGTGLYLLTDERWYPGTVIRMTLTDKRNAAQEKSIMVYASVMRWGNDGVGLAFVIGGDGAMGGASKAELDAFVARMKNSV